MNQRPMIVKFFPALCLSLCLLLFAQMGFARSVEGLRVWASGEKTRLVVDLSDPLKYHVFQLDNPKRVVIDFENARMKAKRETDLKKSVIANIRTGRRSNNALRLVLDVKEPINLSHFTLPPNHKYGHRFVLDLKHAPLWKKAPLPQIKSVRGNRGELLRELRVVIDPGHGGDDPGAIGPRGTTEKTVVLNIAKGLAAELNRELGIQAILTREGDYYIGLRKRRQLARDIYRADLFVSIHADAWTEASARGASVYVVSRKGASSTLAKFLAESANKSDRIGGVEVGDTNIMLRNVLADLALEGNLEHSFRVGDSVLEHLKGVSRLHKNNIGQAGFMVLKSLDVPSILVETGFISNPTEERLLRSKHYQEKLAKALSKGILGYFRHYPPPQTLFAAWYGKPTREHRIMAGETLSGIAEQYGVSLRAIRELNAMRSDSIRRGQVLRVPNT